MVRFQALLVLVKSWWLFFGRRLQSRQNARLKTSLGHHSLAQPDPSRTSGSNLSLPATAQVTIMEPSYSLSKFKTWHAMPLPQVRWRPPKDHRMPVTRETQLPLHLLQPVDLAIHFRRQPLKVFEDGQILPMVFTHLLCVSRSYKYQPSINQFLSFAGGPNFETSLLRWRVEHTPPPPKPECSALKLAPGSHVSIQLVSKHGKSLPSSTFWKAMETYGN